MRYIERCQRNRPLGGHSCRLFSEHNHEPVPLIQDINGDHPACGDAVRSISTLFAHCRRPAPRARTPSYRASMNVIGSEG